MKTRKWLLLVPFCLAIVAQPGLVLSDEHNGEDDQYSVAGCIEKMAREADKSIDKIEENTAKAVEKINRYQDDGKQDKAQEEANKTAVKNVGERHHARDKICDSADKCKAIEDLKKELREVGDRIDELTALIQLNPEDEDLQRELEMLIEVADELADKLESGLAQLVEAKFELLAAVIVVEEIALEAIDAALDGDGGEPGEE